MSGTLTYSGKLTITTCYCGMVHAVPTEMYEAQKREANNGKFVNVNGICCPLGHRWYFQGDGELDRLRRELDTKQRALEAKERRCEALVGERDQVTRRLQAQRGATTRLKNRAASGLCPCCNRHFVDLHAHMDNKHPGFAAT